MNFPLASVRSSHLACALWDTSQKVLSCSSHKYGINRSIIALWEEEGKGRPAMKNLGAQIVPIIQSNVPPLLASYDYECNGSMTIHTKLRTTLSFHCRPKNITVFLSKFVQRTYSEGSDDRSIQSFLCRQSRCSKVKPQSASRIIPYIRLIRIRRMQK